MASIYYRNILKDLIASEKPISVLLMSSTLAGAFTVLIDSIKASSLSSSHACASISTLPSGKFRTCPLTPVLIAIEKTLARYPTPWTMPATMIRYAFRTNFSFRGNFFFTLISFLNRPDLRRAGKKIQTARSSIHITELL